LFADVKTIIFDLDGTLYVSDALAKEIKASSCRYIASIKGVDEAAARLLIEGAQKRLSATSGQETPLTVACTDLGGDLRRLHSHFAAEIRPEPYLPRDETLISFLARLAEGYDLYIYTNNNRFLSDRIMGSLGITEFFRGVFTVEDYWRPKPDMPVLERIFSRIEKSPSECLFVGDRYDIDLRLPEAVGSPVFLVKDMHELYLLLQDIVTGKE